MKNNMEKHYFITIAIILFSNWFAFGQDKNNHIEIDTITVFPNRVLVDFKSYSDTILIKNIQAYLYRDTIEYKKSRWLFWSMHKKIVRDSVVYHGIAKTYGEEGRYRIGNYKNGKKIEMNYFDSKGNNITKHEFQGGLRSQGDSEIGYNIFLIHGNKKKKTCPNKKHIAFGN